MADLIHPVNYFKLRFLLIQGVLICIIYRVQGLDLSQCTMPLGMESGEIPDSDITSSTSFEHGNVGPHIGRVRVEKQGGAWCPKNQITSEAEEWLQIDLHATTVITMAETQGRFGNGQGQEFAENYLISYWRPQLNKWVRYRDHMGKEILKGNINTYLAAKTELNPPIIASKIRIIPYSHHRRTVCMRVEIYGCNYKGGLLSYSMPQGNTRGENWELYDHTYDGQWEGQYLRSGLGQLTDGGGGPVNFKDDFYGPERGKGWVGWKNESRNASDPLEILFTFDSVREFNAVHIHVSNQFTEEIQAFSEARVFFSVGGKLYPGDPILFVSKEDCIFEDPKNITIKLHHRIGQYVKMQFFWASKWILISEITFDSQPAMGNFTEEEVITNLSPEVVVNPENDVSRVVIDNPILPINVANSIVDRGPTVSEELSPATIVMTAIISSGIAVILVLIMILAAFLMRHRLFAQDKVPPPNNLGSLHYGEVTYGHGGGSVSGGCQNDFGYAAPVVLFTTRDTKSKSRTTLASSMSKDYETSKPSFCSFVGSSYNNTPGSNGNSSSSGMAEYYSCAPVPNIPFHDLKTNEYEYVTKGEEFNDRVSTLNLKSPGRSLRSNGTSSMHIKKSHRDRNISLRLTELGLPEIPRNSLKFLRKLGDGVFGSIFVGELQLSQNLMDRCLVTVKRLHSNASEKDKLDFLEEVGLLASLKDQNVTQVLGLCTQEEPFSVALEFLEMGDLCQFLRGNDTLHSTSKRRLSFGDLLHLASQIASGMKFLESKNIVHRDLATRNCVVSRCLTVKISHFATDTGLYSQDYVQLDGKMPLPIRWMAWESVFIGKYSTKSDVWSMGVTLWEILTYCRQSPYPSMTDQEVIHNLRRLSLDDDKDPIQILDHPYNCPRDVYELMCDTWKRNDEERPSFWEIHCFLMRKNMNYNTLKLQRKTPSNIAIDHSSYYV